jgi:hypothetical protein
MSVQFKRAAGTVRILSPAAPAGKPNAAASVNAKSTVSLVATQGARCTVKTNRGVVIGTGRSTSSSKRFTVTQKTGHFAGASSISATCTLGKKSFSSQKLKITVSK